MAIFSMPNHLNGTDPTNGNPLPTDTDVITAIENLQNSLNKRNLAMSKDNTQEKILYDVLIHEEDCWYSITDEKKCTCVQKNVSKNVASLFNSEVRSVLERLNMVVGEDHMLFGHGEDWEGAAPQNELKAEIRRAIEAEKAKYE